MRAIILAAGRGSRMKGATDEAPKCLSKIKGKTLLEMQIKSFKDSGINEIGIITGYLSHLIKDYCETIFYNTKWHQTNMVYSLMHAKEWLRESPCIVSYSDIFYDKIIIEKLIKSKHQISIAYDPNWKRLWNERFEDPLSDAETFRLSNDNSIIEIGNKTSNIEEIQGQYMGLMKFTPNGWYDLEKKIIGLEESEFKKIQFTQLLQKCITLDLKIYAIPNYNPWGEVDSEEDLNFYNLK